MLDFSDLEKIGDPQFEKIPLSILVEKLKEKRRRAFSISYEKKQLKEFIKTPPEGSDCYKILSVGSRGISPLAFISLILEFENIEALNISTFRIGEKQAQWLCARKKEQKIKDCFVFASKGQAEVGASSGKYNYAEKIKGLFEKEGITLIFKNTHSKICLARTKGNFFILETSANFDNCVKLEQYSFYNDENIYNFFLAFLDELKK